MADCAATRPSVSHIRILKDLVKDFESRLSANNVTNHDIEQFVAALQSQLENFSMNEPSRNDAARFSSGISSRPSTSHQNKRLSRAKECSVDSSRPRASIVDSQTSRQRDSVQTTLIDENNNHNMSSSSLQTSNRNVLDCNNEQEESGDEDDDKSYTATVMRRYSMEDDDEETSHASTVLNEQGRRRLLNIRSSSPSFTSPTPTVLNTQGRRLRNKLAALSARRTPLRRLEIDINTTLSPADTNITMDDDSIRSNRSTLLPTIRESSVMDRYRLQRDESSPYGFVVVPNYGGNGRGSDPSATTPTRLPLSTVKPNHMVLAASPTSAQPADLRVQQQDSTTPPSLVYSKNTRPSTVPSHLPFLRPIPKWEFDAATIVHDTTNYSTLNGSIRTLNGAIRESVADTRSVASVCIPESEALRLGVERDQLWVLCHFQRLVQRQTSSNDRNKAVFQVV